MACLLTVCLLVGCLSFLTDLLERKESDINYQAFFEQEEPFDVLFFGSSHVINSVMPMQLWRDYGIISYNMAFPSCQIPSSYWLLQLALQYTSPSLVVVDCYMLEDNYKTQPGHYEYLHMGLDAFPFSLTKCRAVLDLLDDPNMEAAIESGELEAAEKRTALDLLWDFSLYHSRWKELSKADLLPSPNWEKGADTRSGRYFRRMPADIPAGTMMKEDTVGTDYLERILALCRERRIEVILVNIPYPATKAQRAAANRVYEIAAAYGVEYLNFLDMDIINYETDISDAKYHLNALGAGKITAYLGEHLSERYQIPDRRRDERYAHWEQDYEDNKAHLARFLRQQQSLDSFLILLRNADYDLRFDFGDSRILSSRYYCLLLEALGLDAEKIRDGSCITLHGNSDAEYKPLAEAAEVPLRITVTDRDTGLQADSISVQFSFDPMLEEPVSILSFKR